MNKDKLLSKVFPDIQADYTHRDTILYALGVGACDDPADARQLRLVYEKDLLALPSFSCVLAHPGPWLTEPGLEIKWVKLLHAEQSFELQKPLPAQGHLVGKFRITGIADKGAEKGAMLYLEKNLHSSDTDELIGSVRSTYFLRGDGGCGNWGTVAPAPEPVPDEAASGQIDMPTLDISALIYRLSGDYNPLHADPAVAQKAGFEKPILQGLCTYGVACQSLVKVLCDGDASRLRSMSARFTKPVYPGETIRTEFWRQEGGCYRFRSFSVERELVVLDRGSVRITD